MVLSTSVLIFVLCPLAATASVSAVVSTTASSTPVGPFVISIPRSLASGPSLPLPPRPRQGARSCQTPAMRCLSIVHQRDAGPGVFAEAMAARDVRHDEWHVAETADPPADPFGYDAVMTFGGSMHPDSDSEHAWMGAEKELLRRLFEAGVPLLGACLGHQLLGAALGAMPTRAG